MLLFVKGAYIPLIASGQKTSTIRPWRVCSLVPGRVLSFNGRLRVTITAVERRQMKTITDDDARADGFPSRRAFVRAFFDHYPGTSLESFVWILRFAPPNDSDQRARAVATSAAASPE